MLFSMTAGYLLQWTGSYMTLFYIAGSAYLVALVVIQLLVPKIQPVEDIAERGGCGMMGNRGARGRGMLFVFYESKR